MSDLLRKALIAAKKATTRPRDWPDDPILGPFPVLAAFLTTDVMDGKKRETATLTMSVASDGVKLCLKDRATGLICWHTGDTFTESLAALEARLAEGTAEWREDRFAKGQGRK